MHKTSPLDWLQSRGLIHDISHRDELSALMSKGSISFYCGFDPTADSLHVGSMLPLIVMRKLQQFGHKPLFLLGSATGMIGDPSGKSEERKLLDRETIEKNLAGIREQAKLFLSFGGANGCEIVDNGSWTNSLSLVEFLRDVGKHFSVNAMLSKDSVRARLENREQGISYTEFSYMLLQAYDFYWLRREKKCALQIGGSDQWGNITAGIDLIRRKLQGDQGSAFGMTFPLLTTASGGKFGKTEQGAVWLDTKRTSPFRFYQFWLNTQDADVIKVIRLFTDIEEDEVRSLEESVRSQPEKREAQRRLAGVLTGMIHGAEAVKKAVGASGVLFGSPLAGIDAATLADIFSDVPSCELSGGETIGITELLVRCKAAESKGAARRLVEGGGVALNDEKVSDWQVQVGRERFIEGKILVVRTGKKNYFLVRIV